MLIDIDFCMVREFNLVVIQLNRFDLADFFEVSLE